MTSSNKFQRLTAVAHNLNFISKVTASQGLECQFHVTGLVFH